MGRSQIVDSDFYSDYFISANENYCTVSEMLEVRLVSKKEQQEREREGKKKSIWVMTYTW